ncbi:MULTISPECIES: dihydrodipicolinate synthase family protein [unclassified Pseudofrankia]|uniref:dihydrodipicolinate synthase family protein n=1 Tax=unclassified Pseudofrankia TaxID=2994372 RepID=UPI0008DA2FFC|nr:MULTISPECIES: dihydrodipicolinate synthase family protein [unclassified Pseudofrankia]MDT3442188.1 dihydrodipicolinate synthase family protein [Pseudofrankia sp. BMG5.37]OHV43595.1 dihydrodipicolinate synthase family protein [Pseudofrankia sp. BMG5.36]
MPSARDAREWAAQGGLHGIGNSLYTPFSGPDGDDIDYDAYRALVRYCVGDLGHAMLWLTSGIAEWWSLTLDERKKLVEIAIDEARSVAPGAVIQACTTATSAKDSLELTRHAQEHGADICYLQTPPMEVHAGEGVLRFFKYIADRTDIALGMFNSGSSGCVLSPVEIARIYDEVPAVCAIKEGMLQYWRSKAIHALAPSLVVWECDTIVYRAGWLQAGIVTPAQLGTAGYLVETPEWPRLTEYWTRIWDGRIAEAISYAKESGLEELQSAVGNWYTCYPGRPEYFTHWAEAFRYAASMIGLPMGDYPHSRPPQAILPQAAKTQIRTAYEKFGPVRSPVSA